MQCTPDVPVHLYMYSNFYHKRGRRLKDDNKSHNFFTCKARKRDSKLSMWPNLKCNLVWKYSQTFLVLHWKTIIITMVMGGVGRKIIIEIIMSEYNENDGTSCKIFHVFMYMYMNWIMTILMYSSTVQNDWKDNLCVLFII